MAKDPAFLFYSNDFLTGTYTMSDEQVGKYIRLLCLQHQKGTLSQTDMDKVCGKYDKDIYDKFVKLDNGYVNQRLLEESIRRNNYCDSRRNNRKKKIVDNAQSHVTDMLYHMENENENENNLITNVFGKIENLQTLSDSWLKWKEYKRAEFKFKFKSITSEVTALKNLKTLCNGKENIATAIIDQSITNGWKGLFAIKSSKNQDRFNARVDYANRHD